MIAFTRFAYFLSKNDVVPNKEQKNFVCKNAKDIEILLQFDFFTANETELKMIQKSMFPNLQNIFHSV